MGSKLTLPPLGLYIHLPWCVQKCPYCDFNSHALRGELPEDDYIAALLRDAKVEATAAGERCIETIFIGGGTPSLFSEQAIQRLLEELRTRLTIAPNAEITLEANPGTLEAGRFEGFLSAGINRLSIGVQSFHEQHLRALGRIHGQSEAIAAIEQAQSAGFERINVDLMHGLPGQTADDALADVNQALELGIRHISHYQLTLEPGTPFFTRPPVLPDEDRLADIETTCHAQLQNAGLQRYEISAWSVPGEACQHNLNYWQFGDYLAIGAGAHGKLSYGDGRIVRYSKVRMPRQFQQLAGEPDAIAETRIVEHAERPLEVMMNVLRLADGMPTAELLSRSGLSLAELQASLEQARANGWLQNTTEQIAPTPLGQRFLNDLLALFMPEPITDRASGSTGSR